MTGAQGGWRVVGDGQMTGGTHRAEHGIDPRCSAVVGTELNEGGQGSAHQRAGDGQGDEQFKQRRPAATETRCRLTPIGGVVRLLDSHGEETTQFLNRQPRAILLKRCRRLARKFRNDTTTGLH